MAPAGLAMLMLTTHWKARENLYAACLSKSWGLRVGTGMGGIGWDQPHSLAGLSSEGGKMLESWKCEQGHNPELVSNKLDRD